MGAAITKNTTPGELAALLSSLGAAYEAYAPLVIDNGISGASLLSFSNKEEIAEAIAELGISKKMHQAVIAASILEAVEAHAAAPASVFASPSVPILAVSPVGPSLAAAASFPLPVPGPGAAAASATTAAAAAAKPGALSPANSSVSALTLTPPSLAFSLTPPGTPRAVGPSISATDVAGKRIHDAAKWGDMAALRPLVQEWSGNEDVLNWADPCFLLGHGRTPLIIGSCEGKLEAVQLLLATPDIDLNKADDKGWTAVMMAAQNGHAEVVRALLAAPGIDLNKVNRDGWTAVMHAASNGQTEVVRALLAAPGIDLNKRVTADYPEWAKGRTALGLAICQQKPEIEALLRAAGIEVSEADMKADKVVIAGQRIFDAAKEGDMAALRPLLQEWSGHDDVLNWAHPNGWTPLLVSHLEAVELLLATPGIDVNKADTNYGRTAVMWAASEGHTLVVRALLAAPGIDVNKADNEGWTAVMLAACNGRTEVVRALLAAPGIDLNKRATADWAKGKTALGLAIYNNKPAAEALLRAAGAKEEAGGDEAVSIPGASTAAAASSAASDPTTAAAAAAAKPVLSQEEQEEERERREEEEAAAAAARKAPEGTGQRIYDAVEKGDMAALRPLVQEWSGHDVLNWANPDYHKDYKGWTPLIVGSDEGKLEAVKLLVATPGIDVNKSDNNGKTAVMYAAERDHNEVVRALLAVPGIDVNMADNNGYTAVKLAAYEGHTEVAALLRAAGAMEDPNLSSTPIFGFGAQQPIFALPTFSFGAPAPASYNPFGQGPGVPTAFGYGGFGAPPPVPGFNLAPPPPPASATDVTGQRIYDAARAGDVAALRPLVQQWSGNEDVLNWTNADHYGRTPLIIGSYYGKLEAVELLLTTPGVDVNKADTYSGVTAVMEAARKGHIKVVRALLAAPGIDINKANNSGVTAVMGAASEGHTEVVRALLAAPGIDLNKRTTAGKTALGFAIYNNKPEAAALLRAAGAEE